MNYVTAREAKNLLHINATTLKVWKDKGILRSKKLTAKKFLYDVDSVGEFQQREESNRKHVIYARVSTTRQHKDLLAQIETIKSYCLSIGVQPDEIYKEIASGMNENRKELNVLIDEVIQGKVDTVYVSYKDRLARFGFEYLKNLFARYDTKIKVLDELEESNKNFQDELTEDLVSIIHHFSMKLYSSRRKMFKKIENILTSESENKNDEIVQEANEDFLINNIDK